MSDIAIRVDNLGKQYRIGRSEGRASYKTLRESISGAVISPFRWLGRNGRSQEETIWALKDVSFKVKQGESIGIIGRNGAGKSTLLKILSRITEPTRGTVDLYGRVGSLLEVGTGFHPELSGRENIYLNGAILGMRRAEIDRKFDEIVDFAEIEKFIDTPVKHYSSGMYLRLAFAVAAHMETEILLVDEVLAVGDAGFQKKCLGKMGDVAKGGRTILFVSHNLPAIKRICSRGIVLENGFISFDGETDTAVQKYKGTIQDKWFAIFQPNNQKAIRINRLEICASNDTLETGEIDTADGVLIKVRYDVNRAITGAHAFLRIHTDDGETLLSTSDADVLPSRLGLREPGQYNCQICIPPRILGEGSYTITWSAGIPFQENIDVEFHALAFHVVDQKTSRTQFIHRGRPGLLALDIDWNYEENHSQNS